jgi:secreted Zn-dependent insulinase-like peptidase
MPDEEFVHHVEALIAKKLEKDKNLKQEANRYWKEIITPHTYIFDRGINSQHSTSLSIIFD